jgi:hypothetical protein
LRLAASLFRSKYPRIKKKSTERWWVSHVHRLPPTQLQLYP